MPDRSAQSSPALLLELTNGTTQLTVTAEVGSPVTLQHSTNLLIGSWLSLTNLTLLSSSAVLTDAEPTNTECYYRASIVVPANTVWIPAGNFLMGSPTNELQRSANETQHGVTLTRGFFMSRFLVTQANYLSLINTNPSYFNTNAFTLDLNRPVEQVTWGDATNYCAKLTQQERLAGRIPTNWTYRLPTEAEWEYACRAGTTTPFYLGNELRSGMANFNGQYEYVGGVGTVVNPSGALVNRTTAVGTYAPNAWGLYDMAGNVWEWCQDWMGNYPATSVIDPQGPASGTARVFRGGTLNATGKECRSACRSSYVPTDGFNTLGFRVVLVGS
jgi:formylglycine-generating enzyme